MSGSLVSLLRRALLQTKLPEAVQIAVGIGRHGAIEGLKDGTRRFVGFEVGDHAAVFGLEEDELDVMFGRHRVRLVSDGHFDDAIVEHRDYRDVILEVTIRSAWRQQFHRLVATLRDDLSA